MTTATCWSCTGPVGSDYRVDFFLTEGAKELAGPYLQMLLCWPCFSTLSRCCGEEGKGALRHRADAPGAGGGE